MFRFCMVPLCMIINLIKVNQSCHVLSGPVPIVRKCASHNKEIQYFIDIDKVKKITHLYYTYFRIILLLLKLMQFILTINNY